MFAVSVPLIQPTFVPSTEGVQVATYDLGGPADATADTPIIFFSHATGFCGGVWIPLARQLTDRYRCIAFDLRGHGQTDLPDGVSLDWWGIGEDVSAVVKSVDATGPRYAAGHSMGGCAIAIAELDNPGTFTKMWAFEPILFPISEESMAQGRGGRGNQPEPHESFMVEMALKRRDTFDSADVVFERYASRPPFSLIDQDALRAYVDYGFRELEDGSVTLRCRPANEAQVFSNALCGAFERLGELTIPYLVAGSGDGEAPAEMASKAAEAYDNISFAYYDDLNHFGPLQDPIGLAADVDTWFTS